MTTKVLSVVGARPQFIKAFIVSKKLSELNIKEVMVHTGQHYDVEMSDVFFQELDMKTPDFYLGVGSCPHGEQTGKMLIECEKVILKEKPSLILVYGDTNSTLAGALAAVKVNIPVAHVEAGMRSYNKSMPEEINRILTDHISDLLFVPTTAGVKNLENENIIKGVHCVGDVMFDVALEVRNKIKDKADKILQKYGLKKKEYVLATLHRAENTNSKTNLRNIMDSLNQLAEEGLKVFFPVHPRTRDYLYNYGFLKNRFSKNLILNLPVPYSEMVVLESNARVIVTDSGGVQKEAYFYKVPAVIPRNEKEWVELVDSGWNVLTGSNKNKIVETTIRIYKNQSYSHWESFYGDGKASSRIANIIKDYLS